MSKDKLRGRKKVEQQVREARMKDQEADAQLNEMLKGVIDLCERTDIEPETLLYRLGILTHVARKVLLRKQQEMFGPKGKEIDKKQMKLIREDYFRLLQTLDQQSLLAMMEERGPQAPPAEAPKARPANVKRTGGDLPGYC